MSRQYVNFQTSTNTPPANPTNDGLDTGWTDNTAIRPLTNGEPANQTVMRRPDENIRTRTEVVRAEIEALKYLTDADRSLLLTSSADVTWAGLPTGTFTLSGTLPYTLILRPFMAPALSTPSKLVVHTNAGLTNSILFATRQDGLTGEPRQYSGANAITVDFAPGVGTPIAITVNGSPLNHIHVAYDSTAITGTTNNQLMTALLASGVLTTLGVTVAFTGTGTDLVAVPVGEQITQFLSGAADAEQHFITQAHLTSFFADSLNILIEGDVLCVSYADLVLGGNGGRRQSINENPENKAQDAGLNLFLLRRFPERLPGALPLATVSNGLLIFINNRSYGSGETGPLASAASYHGSSPNTWADATTLGSSSFETAFDTIVQLLGKTTTTSGANKIGVQTAGNITTSNVQAALQELDSKKAAVSGPFVIYGSPGPLSGAFRVDGEGNASSVIGGNPFTIKTGDDTTKTLVLRRHTSGGLNLTEWQTESGTVLGHVDQAGNFGLDAGSLTISGSTAALNLSGSSSKLNFTNAGWYFFGETANLLTLGNLADSFRNFTLNRIAATESSFVVASPTTNIRGEFAANESGEVRLRSTSNVPLNLGAHNVTSWAIATDGTLGGVGGNRAIHNVLDPATAQDASTKNYHDTTSAPTILMWGASALDSGGGLSVYSFMLPGFDNTASVPGATEVPLTMPFACVVKSIYAHMVTAGSGGIQNKFQVMKNGAGSGLLCTIASGAHAANNAGSVSFAAGDTISIGHAADSGAQGALATVTIHITLA